MMENGTNCYERTCKHGCFIRLFWIESEFDTTLVGSVVYFISLKSHFQKNSQLSLAILF